MQPSQKAAYVLMEVGIQPWKASQAEIELAERLTKEYRYIESAADQLRTMLAAPARY